MGAGGGAGAGALAGAQRAGGGGAGCSRGQGAAAERGPPHPHALGECAGGGVVGRGRSPGTMHTPSRPSPARPSVAHMPPILAPPMPPARATNCQPGAAVAYTPIMFPTLGHMLPHPHPHAPHPRTPASPPPSATWCCCRTRRPTPMKPGAAGSWSSCGRSSPAGVRRWRGCWHVRSGSLGGEHGPAGARGWRGCWRGCRRELREGGGGAAVTRRWGEAVCCAAALLPLPLARGATTSCQSHPLPALHTTRGSTALRQGSQQPAGGWLSHPPSQPPPAGQKLQSRVASLQPLAPPRATCHPACLASSWLSSLWQPSRRATLCSPPPLQAAPLPVLALRRPAAECCPLPPPRPRTAATCLTACPRG